VPVRSALCGPDPGGGAADALLAPMRAIAAPLLDDVRDRGCTETDALHREPATPTALHDAGVALRELSAEAVDALLAAAGPEVPSPLDLVELRWMGGALARQAAVPNVVAGRAAACSLYARGPVPAWAGASTAVSRVVEAVAPWSLGGALPNFAGVGPPEALWSLGDRVRLRVLRHAVDPDGMFAGSRPAERPG
jgi:hypothetical protein